MQPKPRGGMATLFCLEVREWTGGRAVTLSNQVRCYPGRIDVYEANPDNRWPEYDRPEASRSAFLRPIM